MSLTSTVKNLNTLDNIDNLEDLIVLDKAALIELLYQRAIFVTDIKKIHKTAIIGDRAILTGDVQLGANTIVFYNTMLQADTAPIIIGRGCCIVDGVSMHNKVELGDFVHIAHGCMIHRRGTNGTLRIGSGTLIGFGSQIHANVGKGCQIAPGVIVDRAIPDFHFVYEKNMDDGSKKTIIAPMKSQNYKSVVQMYTNFWGRQIIIKGRLTKFDWNPGHSFGKAVQTLKTFFNPDL